MPSDTLRESPSQTAGPYVHIGLMPNHAGIAGVYPVDLGTDRLPTGSRVTVVGTLFDGAGQPISDAIIECWQEAPASAPSGRFTRAATDPDGLFTLEVQRPTGSGAPQVCLFIMARGINVGLLTRVYFPDHAVANEQDSVLARVPPWRRHTLVATTVDEHTFRHDIHLQGDNETVFFEA